ncbi:hypothetical protein G6L46_05695 [Agrobacterium rhizogenes]|uniref:hypothetical protein n=1 Tax=Rhizobium rhizogenes TaxID=359 RepID=UPI0015724207|nr:hypothetical protein [Rhizobium rhizogenes]NTF86623.1 hypothetical protein [Rhizobium rhizogenes]
MNIADVMRKPRLKLTRANAHIAEIERDANPLSRELYELRIDFSRSKVILREPDTYFLRYKPLAPISEHFGTIMGDVVNNLREALEYWMNMALRTIGPIRKTHFPFAKSAAELGNSKAFREIQTWFPDAANFIETVVRPTFDQKPNLWAVTSLSNYNKHNDLLPAVGVTTIENISLQTGGLTVQSCNVIGPADGELNLVKSLSPIHFGDGYNTKVELKFAGETEFDGAEVIRQLVDMATEVASALDDLEGFISPYCR